MLYGFSPPRNCATLVRTSAVSKEVHLLRYCLLSSHLHLLLETPQGNLFKFMQPLQTSFTLSFNRRHRQSGHVFEQRCRDPF